MNPMDQGTPQSVTPAGGKKRGTAVPRSLDSIGSASMVRLSLYSYYIKET